MKVRIYIVLFSFAAFLSCGREARFITEGSVENPAFEGSKVYLVALDAPISKKVDSTEISNGKFRFSIPADSFGVKILRVPAKFPDVVEDLLVVTEAGTIHARMSAVSTGSGTKLNDMLMAWKNEKRLYDSLQFDSYMRQGNPGSDPELNDSLMRQSADLARKHLSYVVNMINGNMHNGIGLLFFKVYYRDLPQETKNKVLEQTGDEYLKRDLQIWSMVTMDRKLTE